MPLAKALLVLLSATGYQLSVSDQGIKRNSLEVLRGVDARPTLTWRSLSLLCDGLIWTTCFSTAILLCKDTWPADHQLYNVPGTGINISSLLCPAFHRPGLVETEAQFVRITPSFIVGIALACGGGLLRVISSRSLGYMYNSSLTIRPAHRLITTGPYAYVRHPGYAGSLLGVIGVSITTFSSESWLYSCGLLEDFNTDKSTGWILWTWVALNVGRIVALSFSAAKEDNVLSSGFGLEWKHWAWKVPKWFIPGLF